MKKWGIIICIFIIFCLGGIGFSESQPPEDGDEANNETGRETIYKTATEFDYPPFSVTDGGVPDGFSVLRSPLK